MTAERYKNACRAWRLMRYAGVPDEVIPHIMYLAAGKELTLLVMRSQPIPYRYVWINNHRSSKFYDRIPF